jgi:SAM-dependent methyltransferase
MEDQTASRLKGEEPTNNAWYLDPVVAEHKRQVHLALLRRWLGTEVSGKILKTDLFEESNKTDQILFDPLFEQGQVFAFDLAFATVRSARRNCTAAGAHFWVADVRQLPLPAETIDCVISTSTLDHFPERADFDRALDEIIRVVRPGGALILTLDNPHNPSYWGLRMASRLRYTPFPLGYTASLGQLKRFVQEKGLEVLQTDLLIHNPRGMSTLLFIAVRRIAGRHSDAVLRWLLRLFGLLDSLPTRRWTACFVALYARKAGEGSRTAPRV